MESTIFIFVLLCVVWINVEAISVDIPKDVYEVARDRNTTIPCKFTTKVKTPKSSIITWSRRKPDADYDIILSYYYPSNDTDWQSGFDPIRFSSELDFKNGRADLNLSFLRLEDSMIYECRVQVQGDSIGNSDATTTLVVLVAPSEPICKVEGDSEYGQNISLTCSSKEASPAPNYKWQSYDVGNNARPLDSKSTVKEGFLGLFNVSRETSGYYICTSSNKVGSASCNLTVAIMPPSMKMGKTAGIIGGVAAFLLLLVVTICVCCYCRKKNKNRGNEYEMGDREEYSDKNTEGNDEKRLPDGEESPQTHRESEGLADRQDHDVEKRERYDDRRSDYDDRRRDYDDHRRDYDDHRRDYDDRRSDYDDRRSDYDDRRRDYDDRRRDYDDRRSDYDDRRSDYDDRRSDYDDRRSDYSDRRDKYSDRNERYDDDRRYDNDNRRGQR